MKKSLLLAMSLLLVICLASCGGEQAPEHTHNFTEWITTKNATCTENGEMVRSCNCGEKETEVIHAKGHNYVDFVCSVCNHQIFPTEGILYEKSEDETYAMVVGYDGTASKIRIADTYEGLPVTHINENAFYNKVITSVVIPESVTDIGYAPFIACKNLVSIEVDEDNPNYKSINGHLCTKDGKTLIQYAGGTPDTNAVIPDGVTTIGYCALGYYTNIYTISIPNSVTTIGEGAFFWCSNLTSVVIHDGVTIIGDKAFYSCISLISVVIPDSVTTIGNDAFSGCSSLTSVVIGDSVITIGDAAFSGCSSLTSVVIPDSVTTIGDWALSLCSSLASVVIPDSVTTIGDLAFYECSGLTSVVIGDRVTTIGDYAFYGCSNLKDVYYTGSEEEWGAITISSYNSNLTNATKHYNYVPEE